MTVSKEKLIQIINELPKEKLSLIYEIVKEIYNAPEPTNVHPITKH
jgi:hypothetical protein